MKNLNKIINKKWSSKQKYISSIEKSQEIPKIRDSYKCYIYNEIRYNAAFYKNTGNK